MNFPFVFLPGTLCDENLFLHQLSLFSPHVVVNLRTQNSLADMLESVNTVSYEKFNLVGFSMGGYVAQEFALKFPERIHKLAIISSSSEGYPAREKQIVESSIEFIKKSNFTGITDRRLREYLHPKSYENETIKNIIHAMAGSDAKEVYLRQLEATLERRDLKKYLSTSPITTLFVGGKEDQIVSIESIKRSAESHFKAQFLEIENCGHFVPLEKPEILNQQLKQFFLGY